MKKSIFFYFLIGIILISGCAVPISLLQNSLDKNQNTTIDKLIQQKDDYKYKIIKMFKDKKYFTGDIKISINTSLTENKSFSIKSNNKNRGKFFYIGNYFQRKQNDNETNYFDPSNIDNLGLNPYEGDLVEESTGFRLSSLKVNGNDELKFESGIILLELKDSSKLSLFQEKYEAHVLDELNGYYRLKINLNKSPIQNIEYLLKEYNKYIPTNIESIEFSSINSLKTFCIILDFIVNHKDSIKNIILDTIPTELPFTPNDMKREKWNECPSLASWWLKDTNVENAWDYSIGTDVTIAWLETNGYKYNHPEISRRKIDYGDNNATISITNLGTSIVDSESHVYSYLAYISGLLAGNLAETQIFHGHYALMTCCAERNNNINTVGVAPNVKVAPYSFMGIFSMAIAVKRAVSHRVDVIGINQSQIYFTWNIIIASGDLLFAFSGAGPVEAEIKNARINNDIPVVVAAHNFASNIFGNSALRKMTTFYPASDPHVITVGSINPENYDCNNYSGYKVSWDTNIKDFFKNGLGSNYGKFFMVWAPGIYIDVSRFEPDKTKLEYNYKNFFELSGNKNIPTNYSFGGTSAATPFTAGIIALMKSRYPSMPATKIENILYYSTVEYSNYRNKYASPHDNMKNDGFNSSVPIIDAKYAVEQAIKLKYGANINLNNLKAKKFNIGILKDSDIYFNDGSKKKYKESLSNKQKEDIKEKAIEFIGWDNSQFSNIISDNIEILDAKLYNFQQAKITSISFPSQSNTLRSGDNVKIKGTDLYSLTKEPYIIIKNISKPDNYQFKIPLLKNNLNKEGTEINFNFKMENATTLNSDGTVALGENSLYLKMIKAFSNKDYYAIEFNGENKSNLSSNFKIESLNIGNNPKNSMTFSILGQNITLQPNQFIDNDPNTPALELNSGDYFGISLSEIPDLNNIKVLVGFDEVSVKSIVDEYLLLQAPPYVSNEAKNVIIKTVDESQSITYEQALKILSNISNINPKIAFISDRGGMRELYTMDMDGSNQVKLPNSNASNETPKISPDAKKIAYFYRYALYVSDIDGNNKVRVSSEGEYVSAFNWLNNSDSLVYSGELASGRGIYTIKSNGTNKVKIENITNIYEYIYDIQVSLNKDKISVNSFTGYQQSQTRIIYLDGRNTSYWNHNSSYEKVYWLSNDRLLSFFSGQYNYSEQYLYIFNTEGVLIRQINIPDNLYIFDIDYSNGRIGLGVDINGNIDFIDMDINGNDIKRYNIMDGFPSSENNNFFSAYFHYYDNAKKLIFDSELDFVNKRRYPNSWGQYMEIYSLDLQTKNLTKLTNNLFYDGYPNPFSIEKSFNISSNSNDIIRKKYDEGYRKVKDLIMKRRIEYLKANRKLK